MKRTLDDEDLVRLVARGFLNHYISQDWGRPHEKAALTKARNAIKRIKEYIGRSEYPAEIEDEGILHED